MRSQVSIFFILSLFATLTTSSYLNGMYTPRRLDSGLFSLVEDEDGEGIDKLAAALDGGADPDVRDKDGSTPLHRAVLHKSLPMVELLLQHRASPNAQDINGQTPLILATIRMCTEIVACLIRKGANPLLADRNNNTALVLAQQTLKICANPDKKRTWIELVRSMTEELQAFGLA